MSEQPTNDDQVLTPEERLSHQKGLQEILEVIDRYDVSTLRINRGRASHFIPDIQLTVGPRRRDRVFVEYVASEDSLNRDFGGMFLLSLTNEYRASKPWSGNDGDLHSHCYLIVVATEIWEAVMPEELPGYVTIKTRYGEHVISIISRMYFERWLADELYMTTLDLKKALVKTPGLSLGFKMVEAQEADKSKPSQEVER